VRAQYAVVLAHCGEIDPARRLIRELKAFAVSDFRRKELEDETRLIEKIAVEQPFMIPNTIGA
jgi:hypothetical protein